MFQEFLNAVPSLVRKNSKIKQHMLDYHCMYQQVAYELEIFSIVKYLLRYFGKRKIATTFTLIQSCRLEVYDFWTMQRKISKIADEARNIKSEE